VTTASTYLDFFTLVDDPIGFGLVEHIVFLNFGLAKSLFLLQQLFIKFNLI